MNKTSMRAAEAFVNGGPRFSCKNTVATENYVSIFGNPIAWKHHGDIILTLAGWNTKTTRARLNAILHKLNTGAGLVVCKNGDCYLENQDGKQEFVRAHPDCWVRVKPNGDVIVDDRRVA